MARRTKKRNRRSSAHAAKKSRFEKFRGIGNPGIGSGRKAINRWLGELRGH